MSSIFISHSSQDNDAAATMKSWLEDQGHTSLFLDFDPDAGIKAGAEWEQVIYQKLRQCQAVIALITPNWLSSKWCFAEVVQAREKGKAIFVAKVKSCDDSILLADLQHLDLTSEDEEGYYRLAEGLKSKGLDPKDMFNWNPKRPPYPGLQYFDEKDAAIFFGRETEIFENIEVINSLRRKGEDAPRFILFLGASGSGKSSLVRAGLLPRLRKDDDNWLLLRPFRPQKDPIEELAVVLAGAFRETEQHFDWQGICDVLQVASEAEPPDIEVLLDLVRSLQLATNHPEATVLLVIDQAEELIGYSASKQANRFLRLLRAALAENLHLMVLATMRSDFLGEFQMHPDLAGFDYENVTVDPIVRDNFLQIIEKPAALAGVRFQEGLVQTILKDAKNRDVLPLLAFTLRRLYDKGSSNGILEIHEYQSLCGKYRSLSPLEASVRQVADQVIKEAKPTKEDFDALRSAFIPHMVRISEDGQYTRRLAYRDQLPRRAESLLRRFVNARLLVSDRDKKGRETFEVAHEALLRTWPLLGGWLEQDRDKLRQAEGIHRAASEWNEAGQTSDFLVHRESRLCNAQTLVQEERFALPENSIDSAYLSFCIAAQEKRDLEQKEQERARKKRARNIIFGLATGLAVTMATTVLALISNQKAQLQSAKASIQNAETLLALEKDKPPLSALFSATKAGIELQDVKLPSIFLPTKEQIRDQIISVNLMVATKLKVDQSTNNHLYKTLSGSLPDFSNEIELVFDQKGNKLAFLSDMDVALSYSNFNHHCLVPGHRFLNTVRSLDFSPNGEILAFGSSDGSLTIWNKKNVKEQQCTKDSHIDLPVQVVHSEQGVVDSIIFSPSGEMVASGGGDGSIKFWKIDTNIINDNPLKTLNGHKDGITSLAFNHSGLLVSAGVNGKIKFWKIDKNIIDDNPLKTLNGHEGGITSLAFSHSGLLASAGRDGKIKFWKIDGNASKDEPLDILEGQHDIRSITISSSGVLASASSVGGVRLWDKERNEISTLEGYITNLDKHQNGVLAVRFDPAGNVLVTADGDGKIRLWNWDLDKIILGNCNWIQEHLKKNPNLDLDKEHPCI